MTDELGREMTSAEHLAVATGQSTIMDIVHGVALELDAARRLEVHVVMPSGVVILKGELEDEIRSARLSTRLSTLALRPVPDHAWILGVNASSNMFA